MKKLFYLLLLCSALWPSVTTPLSAIDIEAEGGAVYFDPGFSGLMSGEVVINPGFSFVGAARLLFPLGENLTLGAQAEQDAVSGSRIGALGGWQFSTPTGLYNLQLSAFVSPSHFNNMNPGLGFKFSYSNRFFVRLNAMNTLIPRGESAEYTQSDYGLKTGYVFGPFQLALDASYKNQNNVRSASTVGINSFRTALEGGYTGGAFALNLLAGYQRYAWNLEKGETNNNYAYNSVFAGLGAGFQVTPGLEIGLSAELPIVSWTKQTGISATVKNPLNRQGWVRLSIDTDTLQKANTAISSVIAANETPPPATTTPSAAPAKTEAAPVEEAAAAVNENEGESPPATDATSEEETPAATEAAEESPATTAPEGIPTVDIPTVEIPTVDIPDVDIPGHGWDWDSFFKFFDEIE